MPTDPVCKMEISEDTAEATAEYKGRTFYFCSEACRDSFENDERGQFIEKHRNQTGCSKSSIC